MTKLLEMNVSAWSNNLWDLRGAVQSQKQMKLKGKEYQVFLSVHMC